MVNWAPGLLGVMYGQPLLVMFALICFFIGAAAVSIMRRRARRGQFAPRLATGME